MSMMKILPLTAILITAGVSTASAAHSFHPNIRAHRYTQRALNRVEMRRTNQQVRIRQGVRSGTLTRMERRVLKRQQRNIKRMLQRHLRDGRLRPWESASLHRALDRASRNIYRLKHNRRFARFYRGSRQGVRPRPPGIGHGLHDEIGPHRRPKTTRPPTSRSQRRCGRNGERCRRPWNVPESAPMPSVPDAPAPDAPEVFEPPVDELDGDGSLETEGAPTLPAPSAEGTAGSGKKKGKKKNGKKNKGKKNKGKKKKNASSSAVQA